jgi:hypothetical protein
MAWNKELPGDTEKIKSLGTVIRPNWEAIEEGDDVGVANMLEMRSIQLDNRTGLAANTDPQTNAGTHYLYSKDDGDAIQEAFMKDSAANIIQLTNDGGIGSKSMRLHFEDFTNDQGTTVYDERNFVAYWAYINAEGTIVSQSETSGLTCVRTASTSTYTISFTTVQSSINYGVTATALHSAGNPRICHYNTNLVGSFVIQIVNTAGSTITAGSPFTVTVYGGRPT